MCLSEIGRVVAVDVERHTARVEVDDRAIDVSTVALGLDAPAVAVGEWLVIHTGLAVERLDARAARHVLAERESLLTATNPDERPDEPPDEGDERT